HGNVLLKVRSKNNLVTGDIVSKRADIFFDYNFPIDTGMANTTFQSLNNSSFEKDNSISVYPNPANSIVNIKANSNLKSIELYDVQGRILQTKLVNVTNEIIDISNQSNGIYFLKITSDDGVKVEQIVKE
uniref:T9SS type A sorting domain-containing protein n=1 Tax=Flavobacterium sp. TaxID=239 RepID=UPI00375224C1